MNQLLRLSTARTVSVDLVIRPDYVRSVKFTTFMVTNEKQKIPVNSLSLFPKTRYKLD